MLGPYGETLLVGKVAGSRIHCLGIKLSDLEDLTPEQIAEQYPEISDSSLEHLNRKIESKQQIVDIFEKHDVCD